MENTFRAQVEQLCASDKKFGLITQEEYFNLVEELKVAASRDKSKTRRQYYILQRYEVLQCGDVEKLIKKRNEANGEEQTVYYAHTNELYDIVKLMTRQQSHVMLKSQQSL